jgi:transposase InsO family protein
MAMFQSDYPKTRLCQVLALPRSTAYYHAYPSDEQPLQAAISAVAAHYPTYGTRRVAKQLARAPYRQLVNRKRAQRIMRQLGLVRTRRRSRRRTTNSQHRFGRFPNLVAERTAQAPDDIWVSEIV